MSRRRTAASLVAVVALAGGLVLAGAMAAQADAVINFGAPSPTPGSQRVISTTNPILFAGTTTNTNYTDEIRVEDWSSGSPDVLCDSIDPTPGTFSCEWYPSTAGTKEIRVFQGPNSDILTFTVVLPTHTVDQPTLVPAASIIELAGTNAYPFATISAEVIDLEVTLECGPVSVNTDGTWACNIPFDNSDIPPGSQVTAEVTQTHSGTPIVVPRTFDIAPAPPASVTLDSPTNGQVYVWQSGPFVEISGRAPTGGGTVDVELDAGVLIPGCGTLPVDAYGNWSCGNVNIEPGEHYVTARQGFDSDLVMIDVQIPAPEVGDLPLSGMSDTLAPVGGTYALDGYDVHVTVTDGEIDRNCQDPTPFTAGAWSCDVDLGGFDAGDWYTLRVWQEPNPAVPGVTWVVAEYDYEVEPYVPPGTPNLTCSFGANGAFSVSSPTTMDNFEVNHVELDFGSSGPDDFGLQGYCNGTTGTVFPDSETMAFPQVAECTPTCNFGSLDPGLYEVYYAVADDYDNVEYIMGDHSYLFTIPQTPIVANVASTTNSVVMSGSAEPGDAIRIERVSNGATLCSTTATGSGTWACQFPKSSANSARAIAIDPSGGMSAYTPNRAIPVTAPITPVTTPPEPFLVSWFLNFDGDFMDLKPGDSFTINVSGMPEGTEIEVWMHSTPRLLGTATGTGLPMSMDLTVPADIENGAHEIEMIAVTPLGTHYFFTSDAMVSGGVDAAPVDEPETPTEDPAGEGGGAGGGSGSSNREDPAAPSALTESIATLERVAQNPVAIAVAGGLAIALLFLVALPTELLNNSLSSNTNRLGRAYGAVDRAFSRAQNWFIAVTRSPALAAGILVTLVAVVYGFVDPDFGFDIVSLRLVLSLGIAFFILSYGASWLSGLVTKRLWGVQNTIVLQPSIILFAIVGVVVARLLDFSPGFLVGVAIGLELIAASKRVTARAVVVQFAFVVGLSLAAWIAYSLFTPGDDFVGMLTEDMLVAVTAEGLTGALIAIFPLRFLDGREIWNDSKPLWAVTFLVVATSFALLVLPTAIQGTDVSDYAVWVAVFAAFGAVSLAAWFLFARAARKEERAERDKVDA